MKKLLVFNIILLMASCASNSKRGIQDEDFVEVKKKSYQSSDDKLRGVKGEYSKLLNSESLEQVFKFDGEIDDSSMLDKIATLCLKREFKDAFDLIRQNSRQYVDNPIFWNQVGNCYLLKNDLRKSLLFYNRALSLKKNYIPALNNLGIMYLKLNDKERALIAFKKAVRYGQFTKTPRYNLSNLYLGYGLYDYALKELNALTEKNSRDVDVNNMIATAYLMKGSYNKSLNYYGLIDSDYYEYENVGINYALALYLSGNKSKSRKIINNIDLKKGSIWAKYYQESKTFIERDR